MQTIFNFYEQFLSNFSAEYHGLISFCLAMLIVVGIYKIIKKEFIWLIVLVILLPASIPILKNIWQALIEALRYLLSK